MAVNVAQHSTGRSREKKDRDMERVWMQYSSMRSVEARLSWARRDGRGETSPTELKKKLGEGN
jgi:hypothetical protein